MERLTYRDKDGFPMMKKRGGFKQGGVERLAAYEDTHMMPADVTSMRMDMAIIAALFNGVDVDRMKELSEADKAGRLVVHARWLDAPWLYYGAKQYVCSRCRDDGYWRKRELHFKETYCPNCGAKMDGGDDNEAD